jgi:hypothetical protein
VLQVRNDQRHLMPADEQRFWQINARGWAEAYDFAGLDLFEQVGNLPLSDFRLGCTAHGIGGR